MTENTALSRGDRNRNERLAGLRALVPVENAIVGIDLADRKQTTGTGPTRCRYCCTSSDPVAK